MRQETAHQSPSKRSFNYLFFAIVAVSALLYCGRNPQYQIGAYNDDAAYVLAAQEMWGMDAPLTQSTLVHPTPDFPFPGLPVVLAPLVKVVEPHWALMDWFSVVAAAFSVFLLGLWLKTWMAPAETLSVLAIYAFNPTISKFSGILLPTPFFLVAVVGSFFLLDDLLKKPSPLKAVRLGLIVGWGSLIRPEGMLLLLCVPVALVFAKRWKDLGRFLVAPVIFWFLFILRWIKESQSLRTEYGGDLSSLGIWWSHHVVEWFRFSGRMLDVLFFNTLLAIKLPANVLWWTSGGIVVLLGLAVMMAGAANLWKKEDIHRGVLVSMVLFSGLYLSVHVFWHVAIPRYCVVLLPFVLILLARGVMPLLKTSPHRKLGIAAIASFFILIYGYQNAVALHQSLWQPDPMKLPPWKSLAWLDQNTPMSSHVLSTIAPSVTLYSRRPALSLLPTTNSEDFLYLLEKMHLDYIVDRRVEALSSGLTLAEDPNKNWDRIRRWIRLSPNRYPLIYADPIEKVAIYRIAPEPGFFSAYQKYVIAVQDFEAGQPDKAIWTLNNCLTAFPNLSSASNALGVTYYLTRQNLKKAENLFLKAIEVMPDSTSAMLNLACLYHLEGEYEKSLGYVRMGLKVSAAEGEEADFAKKLRLAQERREIELPDHFQ